MKVKCIDDKFSYCGLVVGQEYHAIYLNDEKKDVVINNVCLPLSLFEIIEEEIFSVEVIKAGFTDLVVGDRYFASKFDDETYSISRFKDMRISIPASIDYFKVISEEPNTKIGLDILDITNQGIKHDQHKLKPSLFFDDMPLAINEVLKVLKFGADKYEEGNWLKVDNGMKRYRNASDRHRLHSSLEENDNESGLLHLAHEAVNTLMLLELKLREIDKLRRND